MLPYNKDLDHLQAEARERNRRRKFKARSRDMKRVAKLYQADRDAKKAEREAAKLEAAIPLVPEPTPAPESTETKLVPAVGIVRQDLRNRPKFSSSELLRRFLEDGRRGAVNEKGQTRLIQMFAKMHEVSISNSPRNVLAFQALCERAYGKSKPSDEALDALAKGGVQIVYVAPPELPERSEQPSLPPKPEFIEAEFAEED